MPYRGGRCPVPLTMTRTQQQPTTNGAGYQKWVKSGETYLKRGFSIIPVGKDKTPLIKWKGYQTRQATLEEVQTWCRHEGFRGFAVVTGPLSGVVVLDIDKGADTHKLTMPATPTVKTGGGGRHYYFCWPEHLTVPTKAGIRPNIDVRGEGGCAILPPTIHPSGGIYTWLIDLDTPLNEVPLWLRNDLKEKSSEPWEDQGILDGVPQSKRNDSATKVVGKFLKHFPREDWETIAWPALKGWNLQNKPPLNEAELRSVFESIATREAGKKDTEDKEEAQLNQAATLVEMITKSGTRLFTDQFREPCLALPETPFVASKINSKATKQLLARLFWSKHKKATNSEAIRSALITLQGIAAHEGQQQHVFNRVAMVEGVIYYDIGNNQQVVRIDSSGWQVQQTAPVYFRRYTHQKPQTLPQRGGDLKTLVKHLNIEEELHEILILTYLPVCLIPNIPRPLMIAHGDQGSAKSTLMKVLRELVDPSQVALLAPPDSIRELVQLAAHHFVVYLDNLSRVSEWLSDGLCRLVTGDGFSKRQLYTDDDDVLYSYQRVAGTCGINQVATKPDLLDRSIIIPLERIPSNRRQEESQLWEQLNQEKPQLFGALLDTLSACLRIAPTLEIPHLPRMADYFRYALAAAIHLGYDPQQLTRAFERNVREQNQEAIEASATAQTIIEYIDRIESNEWEGTSSNLFEALEKVADDLRLKKGFPKAANWLWRRIKEVRPNLMAFGVHVDRREVAEGSLIRICKEVKENAATTAILPESTATPGKPAVSSTGSNGNSGSSHPQV